MSSAEIIVVCDRAQGLWLQKFLRTNVGNLTDIDVATKEDIISNPTAFDKVEVVFSTWNMPVFSSSEVKKYFPELKSIFYAAGATEYFAKAFVDNEVVIYSAIEENSVPVAEFTVAQAILANKGFFQAQKAYRKPFWYLSQRLAHSQVRRRPGNYRSKIGLIGCGVVGKKVAGLLKSYEFDVYICDPKIDESLIERLGAKKCGIQELFATCDVISNHLPDLPETKGIIDYPLMSLMKDTAVFINTGRGAQVNEKDLVRVLRKKPNCTALLDVTTKEPIRPWSRVFWCKNTYLTPHIAGSQSNEYIRLAEAMVRIYLTKHDYLISKS